jgi:hypothetical protein
MRINLIVPYKDKDLVKTLGAKWDLARKIWYITDIEDVGIFLEWMPEHYKQPTKDIVLKHDKFRVVQPRTFTKGNKNVK